MSAREAVPNARRQTAHLQAAARGDLDDAVAMRRAASAQRARTHRARKRPVGRSRTSSPSPVMHRSAKAPGHGAAAPAAHSCRIAPPGLRDSASRSSSTSLRRGCQRPVPRAAASRSATVRAAAAVLPQQKVAHRGLARHRRHARDRTGRSARRRSSRQRRRGGRRFRQVRRRRAAPWRMLPGDEARVDGAARTMRATRCASERARGRCGSVSVEHDQIGRAAERRCGGRKAADEGGVLADLRADRGRDRRHGCTRRSAVATRSAKAPGAALPSPSAPP